MNRHLEALTSLMVRPQERDQLSALRSLVDAKLAELDEVIRTRQTQGSAAALAIVMSDRGKVLMDRIRTLAEEMNAVSERRIADVTAVAQARADRTRYVSFGGSILLLVLFVAATLVINRGTNRRHELIATIHDKEFETARARDLFRTTLASIGDAVIATDSSGAISFPERRRRTIDRLDDLNRQRASPHTRGF